MISTNKIFNCYKDELKYQIYSKTLLLIFIITIGLSTLNLFGLVSKAEGTYDVYVKTYNEFKDAGIDVEAMLKSPINRDIKQNGSDRLTKVDNPVRFQFEEAGAASQLLKGTNIITNTLEWLDFVFFPIIFTLLGIHFVSYDYKYKTYKLKVIKAKWNKLFAGKLFALFTCTFFIFIFTLIASYMIGLYFHSQVVNRIPIEQFSSLPQIENNKFIIQLVFSLFICIFFSLIGFLMGILFKSFILPTIIFLVFNLLLPVLGKYDIRNMIAIISHEIFEFKGRFILFMPAYIPLYQSIMLLVSITCFMIATSFFYLYKQGIYYN
ncbi:hypothetical protein BBD42_02610 [Paenibacillus sp. BIHB 4019]|uniref:Uncharacterized protein n=1 Tax=Paenibacillus sp. BIHB 4019 TaxID=1870819 RepID=A0A1B2DCP8_9BACL|nr:hypothetical protein [Paenibacillus sp. BIHB 4019]ANY65479.1 hypothetical protein BBD42_02610 [Paenibacillus sp. BIHB 4019]